MRIREYANIRLYVYTYTRIYAYDRSIYTYNINALIPGNADFGALGAEINADDTHTHGDGRNGLKTQYSILAIQHRYRNVVTSRMNQILSRMMSRSEVKMTYIEELV
jgi:hypothetical protein